MTAPAEPPLSADTLADVAPCETFLEAVFDVVDVDDKEEGG
jgi:hypothetical protein